MSNNAWVRGVATLAVVGGLAAALIASPVGALDPADRGEVKRIAAKQATKVFKRRIGPAIRHKQDRCRRGAVLAFGFVNEDQLDGTLKSGPVTPQFNCSGGQILAREDSAGEYELVIPGITTPDSLDVVATISVYGNDAKVNASYFGSGADFMEVTLTNSEGAFAEEDFAFSVFSP